MGPSCQPFWSDTSVSFSTEIGASVHLTAQLMIYDFALSNAFNASGGLGKV